MISKRLGVQLAASGLVMVLGAWGVALAQRNSETPDQAAWETETHPVNEPPMPIAAADAAEASGLSDRDAGRYDDAAAEPPGSPEPPGPTTGFASLATADSEDSFAAGGIRQVAHEDYQAAPEDNWALPPQQLGFVPQDDDGVDDSSAAEPAVYDAGPAAYDAGPAAYAMGSSATTGSGTDTEDAAAVAPGFALPADSNPASSGLELPAWSQPSNEEQQTTDPNRFDSAESMPTLDFAGGPVNELRAASNPENETVDVADSGGSSYENPPSDFVSPNDYASASDFTNEQPADFEALPTGGPASAGATIVASSLDDSTSPGSFDSAVPQASRDASVMTRSTDQPYPDTSAVADVSDEVADVSDEESVLNEPGDRRLDGMQAPSVVIHKRAPDQVKVGKPTTFTILVQNVGGVEAMGVQVYDRIPAGMRLLDATPQPQRHDDLLLWSLGALEPGGERTVSMQLVPEQEGELGSVARVTFEAAASVRTISTRPALKVVQRSPQQVLIGQQVEIEIEVSNPGTGEATGVILQTDVPDGLEHPKGRQLDNLIGTLAPGEVRRQVLRLRAVAAGSITNEIRITADDGLEAVDSAAVEIIAPQLAVELEGPSRRFLERQATYNVNLANVGSAEATNVEIVAYLDRGFSFVGTEYQGQYDPSRHAVYWSLAELPADARGAVPLTLLPIERGERAIRLEARGDLNLVARHEKRVSVDALAELTFSITDDVDPIEVGGTVTYEIKLVNRGSGDDSDVKLQLQLPAGLELISSESDAATDGNGLVVFTPQAVMAARSEVIHRVRVKGVSPGTHVVKAIVSSDESPVEVTKEESTTVYADE